MIPIDLLAQGLHGHAHAGTLSGRLGEVPVYNVSVPCSADDFWVFEMTGARRMPSEVVR